MPSPGRAVDSVAKEEQDDTTTRAAIDIHKIASTAHLAQSDHDASDANPEHASDLDGIVLTDDGTADIFSQPDHNFLDKVEDDIGPYLQQLRTEQHAWLVENDRMSQEKARCKRDRLDKDLDASAIAEFRDILARHRVTKSELCHRYEECVKRVEDLLKPNLDVMVRYKRSNKPLTPTAGSRSNSLLILQEKVLAANKGLRSKHMVINKDLDQELREYFIRTGLDLAALDQGSST